MRLGAVLFSVLMLAGMCFAQDTNFPVGPQYLITSSSSPLFLRPIATPSLSFQSSLAPVPAIETQPGTETQPSAAPPAIQTPPDLSRIYWGGETPVVIEMTGGEPMPALPASLLNLGVTGVAGAQGLRERGIGVTAAEAASFWKTHKTHATRVYTNSDIERLHGG